MARILVTGGAGFIGSSLAFELAKNGEEVVVLDDMSLGKPENLSDAPVEVRVGDITRPADIEAAMEDVGQVYHFASASSAPMYEPDPRRATQVTLNGFLNVLEAARKSKVKGIVFASSSSVYGNNPTPHSEAQAIAPISFYTAAKMSKEFYAQVYSRMYGMDIAAMRFFSVYGPREKFKGRYANIISQFLWKMKKGESPVLYGNGSQTRDYIYIDDVVRCCLLAMEKKANGAFNVGTGRSASFNDVVSLLNKALGTKIKPAYVPNPIGNYVAHTLADTAKAERELGFKARLSLEDGIRELLKSY